MSLADITSVHGGCTSIDEEAVVGGEGLGDLLVEVLLYLALLIGETVEGVSLHVVVGHVGDGLVEGVLIDLLAERELEVVTLHLLLLDETGDPPGLGVVSGLRVLKCRLEEVTCLLYVDIVLLGHALYLLDQFLLTECGRDGDEE